MAGGILCSLLTSKSSAWFATPSLARYAGTTATGPQAHRRSGTLILLIDPQTESVCIDESRIFHEKVDDGDPGPRALWP